MTNIMTNRLIDLQSIYHSYEDLELSAADSVSQKNEKLVLNNINLSINNGEFLTIVGPSGCGKSTLLRLIIGEEFPTMGRAIFDNNLILSPCCGRAIVYQNYSLFKHLSVLDNILSAYRLNISPLLWWRKKKQYIEEVMPFIIRAGLEDHIAQYPYQLSGGQQQKVAIIQSIVQQPKVLCMDEPFSALDPGSREDMQLFLLELWENSGLTVLFVTHDLQEAAYLGSRLIALSPYYQQSEDGPVGGSKIVCDYQLSQQALPPTVKDSETFSQFISKLKHEAFNPKHRQHSSEFSLNHKYSFYY